MMKINLRNRIELFIIPAILILAFFVGCKDNDNDAETVQTSPRIKKSISVISPTAEDRFLIGDTVVIEVAHSENKSIDSIELNLYDQKFVKKGEKINWIASMTGKPSIKLQVYHKEGSETVYPAIEVRTDRVPENLGYRVLDSYPHDESAYTQGLYFHDKDLIESTGQRGSSTIRKVDYRSGEIISIYNLEDKYFGEGTTVYDNRIYQLTWTSQKAFVYDLNLNPVNTLNYSSEGWGLTHYKDQLILSDGSNQLKFLNPGDFFVEKVIEVYDHNGPVDNLNELEVIDNVCYANIYGKDMIVGIDLSSGEVIERIDFEGIVDRMKYRGLDYVLNGIAYLAEDDKIFVTGKLWPKLFEVEFIKKND